PPASVDCRTGPRRVKARANRASTPTRRVDSSGGPWYREEGAVFVCVRRRDVCRASRRVNGRSRRSRRLEEPAQMLEEVAAAWRDYRGSEMRTHGAGPSPRRSPSRDRARVPDQDHLVGGAGEAPPVGGETHG